MAVAVAVVVEAAAVVVEIATVVAAAVVGAGIMGCFAGRAVAVVGVETMAEVVGAVELRKRTTLFVFLETKN